MIMKRLPTGMFSSNCYIIGGNGEGILIDSGVNGGEIVDAAEKLCLSIKYIILTHAHIDHICSMDEIREKLGAKVALHEADIAGLSDPRLNVSMLIGLDKTFKDPDILLKHGDVIEAGGIKFEIIHTPGHTPGSICIKAGSMVFTGDTLFRMSIGRTDLGNGDEKTLIASIRSRLMVLDDENIIYPGHGTSTTIGYERKNNPFV